MRAHAFADRLLVGVALATTGCAAWAQPAARTTYPAKPVRMVIPSVPGGSLDFVSRVVAQRLTDALGQQVVADNRPGASGIVASELVARAPGDGYTVLMGYSSHATNPSLYAKLPYDTLKDFAPVTQVAALTQVLVAHPSLPVRSAGDLIALAKARPGELTYASPGIGAAAHLAAELFRSMAKTKMLHVPYKGGAPATLDLLSGHVMLMFNGMPVSLPHLKAGKLRGLAVSTAKRSPVLPDLPALAETLPGYDVVEWNGMFAPGGTPAPVVSRLQNEIAKILQIAEVRERLSSQGADPVGNTPDAFAAFLRTEVGRWAQVVRDAGIRIE